jgi:hypothetical protein
MSRETVAWQRVVIMVEGRPCATIAVAFGVTDNRYTSGVPFMVGVTPPAQQLKTQLNQQLNRFVSPRERFSFSTVTVNR